MIIKLAISFCFGFLLASLISFVLFLKKETNSKEELIKLRAKAELSENLQEIIKRDFVQIANETIKNEQEDLSCLKHTIYGDYNQVTVAEVVNLMKGDGSGRVSR